MSDIPFDATVTYRVDTTQIGARGRVVTVLPLVPGQAIDILTNGNGKVRLDGDVIRVRNGTHGIPVKICIKLTTASGQALTPMAIIIRKADGTTDLSSFPQAFRYEMNADDPGSLVLLDNDALLTSYEFDVLFMDNSNPRNFGLLDPKLLND